MAELPAKFYSTGFRKESQGEGKDLTREAEEGCKVFTDGGRRNGEREREEEKSKQQGKEKESAENAEADAEDQRGATEMCIWRIRWSTLSFASCI